MEPAAALVVLARYASAYPSTLDGIAERLEAEGKAERATHYRRAFREVAEEVDRARIALKL